MALDQIVWLSGLCLVSLALAGGAWLALAELRLRAQRRARLQPARVATAASSGVAGPLLGAVRRLGQQSAVRDPANLSVLRLRLMQAGFYNREAPVIFLGAKAACLAAATVGVMMTLPMMMGAAQGGKGGGMNGIFLAAGVAGAAMMGPEQVLKSRRRSRELEYADGFPDLLDLLVASVEAGLSLDAAVSRVTDELGRRYPNLVIHLRFLVLELRAGKTRKDAWAAFAERLGTDDARALAVMLRQAEEMGTSLAETLTVFSQDMRSRRMLKAEEKALALSAKLTVPLILFIFPCLLGSLLLPAIFRVLQTFSEG